MRGACCGAQRLLDETLTARQAEEIGLVYEIVPDDQLDATMDTVADQLGHAGHTGHAVIRASARAWAAGGVASADAVQIDLGQLFESQDMQASITAFADSLQSGQP